MPLYMYIHSLEDEVARHYNPGKHGAVEVRVRPNDQPSAWSLASNPFCNPLRVRKEVATSNVGTLNI